jgi:hypothetical protein
MGLEICMMQNGLDVGYDGNGSLRGFPLFLAFSIY